MTGLLPVVEAYHYRGGMSKPQFGKRLGREGCAIAALALENDVPVKIWAGRKADLFPDLKFEDPAGNVDRPRHMSGGKFIRLTHVHDQRIARILHDLPVLLHADRLDLLFRRLDFL